MRIRVVGPVHPYKGGIAQHTTRLAHRLAADGHDVVVESWDRQYPQSLYPGQQRVTSPEGEPFAASRFLLSWNRPDSWVRLGRRLRAEADLVVIVMVSPVQVPAYVVALAALGRRPRPHVVVLSHNVLPHERGPLDQLAVRRLFGRADQVLVHSDLQRQLAQTLTATPVVVRPLPPHLPSRDATAASRSAAAGASPEPAAPGLLGASTPRRHLLFFGLVRRYKGVDVLVRALAHVSSDITLTVAGEFWRGAEDVREAIRAAGVEHRVDLQPGYVPVEQIPALFAAADALVLPYRQATGTQNVALAFSYGLPVVATTAGTLPVLVRDGEDGLLCAPDDVAALAAALRRLYEPGVLDRLRRGVHGVDDAAPWREYVDALVSSVPTASAS